MRDILEKLLSIGHLDVSEVERVFNAMLTGELTEIQTAAFLAAWRAAGESARELAAGAKAMRQNAEKVEIPSTARPLVDNCGTGGDGSHSFNISTAAAIIAAAAGAKVAKHGNRSVSSKCGSADLLFEAGYPATMNAKGASALLEQTGFTFFFAPSFHPLMKHVMPVRKGLGVRTIFNLLGPLANPIRPERQLIGVGRPEYMRPMAEALAELGIERAMVVHSRDGLDEISPAAVTDAVLVQNGSLTQQTIDPTAFGIRGRLADLGGGDAKQNLAILDDLLNGKQNTVSQTVVINAAAVLWVAGVVDDMNAGFERAQDTLASGRARSFFDDWLAKAAVLGGP